MQFYKTKANLITGSSFREVHRNFLCYFNNLKSQTKRKAYIRSKYFKNQKIFLDYFLRHLNQKPKRQRISRMKLFLCAINLIKNNYIKPDIKYKNKIILYRFYGINTKGQKFAVQIKQNLKQEKLFFMSCFPWQ